MSDATGPGGRWTVIYAVEVSGSGSVTGIAHDDGGGGTVTVTDPRAGWTTSLLLPPGASVAIRGRAVLGDGRFRLLLDARSPGFPPVIRVRDCSGTATACDLEIPRETLP